MVRTGCNVLGSITKTASGLRRLICRPSGRRPRAAPATAPRPAPTPLDRSGLAHTGPPTAPSRRTPPPRPGSQQDRRRQPQIEAQVQAQMSVHRAALRQHGRRISREPGRATQVEAGRSATVRPLRRAPPPDAARPAPVGSPLLEEAAHEQGRRASSAIFSIPSG